MYLMLLGPFALTLLVGMVATSASIASDTVAAAVDEPLGILGIVAGSNRAQAEALTAALKQTLDASLEWKDLDLGSAISTWMSLAHCPEVPDAPCLSRIAGRAGVTRFVWGTLKQKQGRVVTQLWLYQTGAPSRTAQLEYSASMVDTFDENLLRLANNGLVQLLGVIHFPVLVRSQEPRGTLVVDDLVVGNLETGSAEIGISAGDHRFRLVLPDATVIARSFQVRAQSANHLRLDFISIPES